MKYAKTGISFILAIIDIALVADLERGAHDIDMAAAIILCLTGVSVFALLNNRLLCQKERRLILHSFLWSLAAVTAYVAGCLMRRDGTLLESVWKLPGLLYTIIMLSVPTAGLLSCILQGSTAYVQASASDRSSWKTRVCQCIQKLRTQFSHSRFGSKTYARSTVFAAYFIFILLCWLPVFLAYYPSVFAYDAEGQLYQVMAGDYSTHHPLLHTLFLGAFFRIGEYLLGSVSAGMALHSVVQMLLMAGAFAYTLAWLYRRETSVYLRLLLLAFYALFPTNSILALSTTKDVLFSALVLLYTLQVYRMLCVDTADDRGKAGEWIPLSILIMLMLLMRNNAVYAFAVGTLLTAMLWHSKKDKKLRRKFLLISVTGLCLFAVANAGLKAVTHAQSGSPREMLSIPLQQMARTRVKEEETLSEEMRQELDEYLSSEWVFAAYNPHLADPVKQRAAIHDNPIGFLHTWAKLGLEHPQTYIDAFLDTSIGYWFLEDRTHAEIYGLGTESGFGYLSTDNRVMPAGYENVEHSYLPGLRAFMEKIVSDNAYQKIPVIRMMFAPAFYWWLLCLYLAVSIYRKKYIFVLPVLFLVIYYLTLLLSPTVLIRYMYPFVVTVPAISCCLCKDAQWKENDK